MCSGSTMVQKVMSTVTVQKKKTLSLVRVTVIVPNLESAPSAIHVGQKASRTGCVCSIDLK